MQHITLQGRRERLQRERERGAYPGSDKVIEARDTEPDTERDGVEEKEDKVLVIGVPHTVVDPAAMRHTPHPPRLSHTEHCMITIQH